MATRRTPDKYDFRHQLFDEVLLPISGSKRRSTPRAGKVKHVDIHHMAVQDSNNGAANFACLKIWKTRQASAHYCVDNHYVLQAVYDNRAAWGNANSTANHEGIIVEHANSVVGDKGGWKISDTTLETSAKLVAGLHITHKLGRPTSVGFGQGGTIRTHQSFYPTACPGPYFKKMWSTYVRMVQKAYDNMTQKPSTPTPAPVPGKPKPVPTPSPAKTRISALHWNVAGSDTVNGYKKANGYRGDDVARHAVSLGFDVFLTCENGQKNLLAGMNKVLKDRNPWMAQAKGIWHTDKVKRIRSRRTYRTNLTSYLKTTKYGAAFFGEKDGKKFSILEIHTDYRKPAKQAKQVLALAKAWKKDCDALRIPQKNRVIVGDFNWDGSKGDDPFKALGEWDWIEHGSRTAATFLDGRHLDGVLAHKDAELAVGVKSRSDGKMKLSDHMPIRLVLTLV